MYATSMPASQQELYAQLNQTQLAPMQYNNNISNTEPNMIPTVVSLFTEPDVPPKSVRHIIYKNDDKTISEFCRDSVESCGTWIYDICRQAMGSSNPHNDDGDTQDNEAIINIHYGNNMMTHVQICPVVPGSNSSSPTYVRTKSCIGEVPTFKVSLKVSIEESPQDVFKMAPSSCLFDQVLCVFNRSSSVNLHIIPDNVDDEGLEHHLQSHKRTIYLEVYQQNLVSMFRTSEDKRKRETQSQEDEGEVATKKKKNDDDHEKERGSSSSSSNKKRDSLKPTASAPSTATKTKVTTPNTPTNKLSKSVGKKGDEHDKEDKNVSKPQSSKKKPSSSSLKKNDEKEKTPATDPSKSTHEKGEQSNAESEEKNEKAKSKAQNKSSSSSSSSSGGDSKTESAPELPAKSKEDNTKTSEKKSKTESASKSPAKSKKDSTKTSEKKSKSDSTPKSPAKSKKKDSKTTSTPNKNVPTKSSDEGEISKKEMTKRLKTLASKIETNELDPELRALQNGFIQEAVNVGKEKGDINKRVIGIDGKQYGNLLMMINKYSGLKKCAKCAVNHTGAYNCRLKYKHTDPDHDGGTLTMTRLKAFF